jgi:hypothetical protein
MVPAEKFFVQKNPGRSVFTPKKPRQHPEWPIKNGRFGSLTII